jgi:hypothetical protein
VGVVGKVSKVFKVVKMITFRVMSRLKGAGKVRSEKGEVRGGKGGFT